MTAALPVRISPVVVYFLLLPLFGVGCARFYRQRYDSFITRTPLAADEYLVSGFLGGLEAWNRESQGGRRLALELGGGNLPGVDVETVEDRKRLLVPELIRRAFDRNRDVVLDGQQRRSVRLILYGMSFGGAGLVKLARQLKALDIPVLLLVHARVSCRAFEDEC